jgi:hypothetical protein
MADEVLQIRRIEGGTDLGGAAVARIVAKLPVTSYASTGLWRIKRATLWQIKWGFMS